MNLDGFDFSGAGEVLKGEHMLTLVRYGLNVLKNLSVVPCIDLLDPHDLQLMDGVPIKVGSSLITPDNGAGFHINDEHGQAM